MKYILMLSFIFSAIVGRAQNWNKVDLGSELSQNSYNKIHFVNDSIGVIVGLNGVIIRTTDGGFTWKAVETGVLTHFMDISFADENIGFVNGMKTEDGGATWILQESSVDFTFLHALNEDHIIANTAIGANIYYESLDGGETWDTILIPSIADMDLYAYYPNGYSAIDDDIAYLSLSKGIIAHADTMSILKTIDGGYSWNVINVPSPDPTIQLGFGGFNGISFPSEDIGLLLHDEGVLKTLDGGQSFIEIIPGAAPEYWLPVDVYAESTDHFLLVGLKPFITDPSISMFETMDGGNTWTEAILAPGNEYLNDAYCTSINCFASGAGGLYRKFDAIPTSIQDIVDEKIEIYPNPTTDYLHIGKDRVTFDLIEIVDVTGKQYRPLLSRNNVLDVSNLPSGIFFLKVEYNGKVDTFRFVKKIN